MRVNLLITCFVLLACAAAAQQSQQHEGMNMPEHQHEGMQMQMPDQQHAGMQMGGNETSILPMELFSSGTAWQPAQTPHSMWQFKPRASWQLMLHGNLSVTFDDEGGRRGVGKLGSMNFLMLMEQHKLGRGTILFREMFSAEALTTPHGGFPELFQTGETYHGAPLVDRQHPHDVFGELSATYLLPLRSDKLQWFAYGALAGEPALGPVAYLHRESASELPRTPLGHHLQDSTHISYGVLTSGVIFRAAKRAQIKLEGSAFNGREPDERRYTMDFAPLDSWSGRASARIGERWAAQYSFGHLVKPEAAEPGNLTRQTASLQYSRTSHRHEWLNTIAWGRNRKQFSASPQNSYLLESLLRRGRNAAFTRMELVDKDELFPPQQTYPPNLPFPVSFTNQQFRIGAFTFGGLHRFIQNQHWNAALGADFTVYAKPRALDAVYGTHPVSFQIFLRLRPGAEHSH